MSTMINDEPAKALTSDDLHPEYVAHTIRELETFLKERQQKLADLTSQNDALPMSKEGILWSQRQVTSMIQAYETVAAQAPPLPFPDSVLPALLAMDTTNRIIQQSRTELATRKRSHERAQEDAARAKRSLQEERAVETSLRKRTQTLRAELDVVTTRTPEQTAREKIADLERQQRDLGKNIKSTKKVLKSFIDQRLAVLLAAEELGGPVAGETVDLDEADIGAGFTAQGKRKKVAGAAATTTDKRQRRLDDMFDGGRPKTNDDGDVSDDQGGALRVEESAQEMQTLTSDLINALLASEGDGDAAYISLEKESASSRFLLRSSVAQAHPRDALRLRLIDFGSGIDD